MKPTGTQVAQMAVNTVHTGYTYDEMDCQAFVEHAVKQAGGSMEYRGSNHMARNVKWLGTIENAQGEGKLVPGALLFIHEDDESDLPAQYRGDGLGDFYHVGVYAGKDALTDTDKNGRSRSCDVAHSSETMGRTAGSTLQNGWTHVGWAEEIDYGVELVGGVTLGAAVAEDDAVGLTAGDAPTQRRYAIVQSPNGYPVKIRKTASQKERTYWLVNHHARVEVERSNGKWALVRAMCTDGYVRRAYMMEDFLQMEG